MKTELRFTLGAVAVPVCGGGGTKIVLRKCTAPAQRRASIPALGSARPSQPPAILQDTAELGQANQTIRKRGKPWCCGVGVWCEEALILLSNVSGWCNVFSVR